MYQRTSDLPYYMKGGGISRVQQLGNLRQR